MSFQKKEVLSYNTCVRFAWLTGDNKLFHGHHYKQIFTDVHGYLLFWLRNAKRVDF